MNKKNIEIGIIVIVFLIIGYIVYRGFFGSASEEATLGGLTELVPGAGSEVAPVTPILSKGNTLDFEPVGKYNSQQQMFNYPKVGPEEVNIPLSDLIK